MGVFFDLALGKLRAGLVFFGGVSNLRGVVADYEDGLMAHVLELAKLPYRYGVSEVDVRRGGVDAVFDAERCVAAKLGDEFFFGDHVSDAALYGLELLFPIHGFILRKIPHYTRIEGGSSTGLN